MNIGSCTSCAPRFEPIPGRSLSPNRSTRESERLLIASASQSTDASLRVVTDDGDVVTLTAHQESSATYADYRRRSHSAEGGSRTRVQVFEASSQQSFSITIEGSLDDEEKSDLQALIQRVAASYRRFEQGDAAGAQSLLADGGDLGSLESFAVSFERETTVTAGRMLLSTQPIGEREETAAPWLRQGPVTPMPVSLDPSVSPVPRQPASEPVPGTPVVTSEARERGTRGPHHGHRGRNLERVAGMLTELVERLSAGRPAFDAERAMAAIRGALAPAAPGQSAPTALPVREQPVSSLSAA